MDLTEGSISRKLILFAFPMMLGNVLQQLYNIVDTLVVGRWLGDTALAAVGAAYTLMILLTSIIGGLCMGSGALFSIRFGRREWDRMKRSFYISFVSIAVTAIAINVLAYLLMDGIIWFMRIPSDIRFLFRRYLLVIFGGIMATFLYNYFANLLRAVGDSRIPLLFLGSSSLVNIGLDLFFVIVLEWGVTGAAAATVIAQYFSGIGISLYCLTRGELCADRKHRVWDWSIFREIADLSLMTCMQQSIMNFGILMVQGLVNSFGTVVMAAFAAGVKIDTIAYSPAQDFGNAFSTFIAQNYGAGKKERIARGVRTAGTMAAIFCMAISMLVFLFAYQLMGLFVAPEETEVISAGVSYLRIEGACYVGIGLLFLLYGYYRAIKQPEMSVILTVISLGTRVVLAYVLSASPQIGVVGIWAAIPIGWALADLTGILYWRKRII